MNVRSISFGYRAKNSVGLNRGFGIGRKLTLLVFNLHPSRFLEKRFQTDEAVCHILRDKLTDAGGRVRQRV
jgi:hypothetical protein